MQFLWRHHISTLWWSWIGRSCCLGTPPSVEKPYGPYPLVVKSKSSGREVPVVQAYAYGKYVGRLKVTFDEQGEATDWSGNPILLDASVAKNATVEAQVLKMKSAVDRITEVSLQTLRTADTTPSTHAWVLMSKFPYDFLNYFPCPSPPQLWEAKFFILCDVICLVKLLQGKFEINHSLEWKGWTSGRVSSIKQVNEWMNQWINQSTNHYFAACSHVFCSLSYCYL